MNWFFIAISAPFIWGFTNFIDKYLVERYTPRIKFVSFPMTSGMFVCLTALVILIIKPAVLHISPVNFLLIITSGIFSMIYLLPYYRAMSYEETSIVIPMLQMVPILGLVLAYIFLHEHLKFIQIIGGLIIICGALGLSLDLRQKIRLKEKVFLLMFLSSLLVSIDVLLYKIVAVRTDFWTAIFWGQVGWFLSILFLLTIKSYRDNFINVVLKENKKFIFIVGLSEMLSVGAGWLFSVSYLLAPIALVQFLGSLQPLFVFVFGLLLSIFWPKLVKENLEAKLIAQKIVFIGVILLGSFILYKNL